MLNTKQISLFLFFSTNQSVVYTAGRPGGPDFYVSTEDNTRNHGPGGQASYALPGEADPCFGKVVEGFEAVDRMHKMSVQPGGYRRMKNFVAIKSVKILNEA
jgi:cyclophilin family peptidyl-prolyl cis-trans isomerase